MKAHIFILQGQSNLAKAVSSFLRDEIHRDIEIKVFEIDPKYNAHSWSSHGSCKEYLRFLRASLSVSDPFDIVVTNDWETQWCYLGYTADFGGYCFELKQMQMTALFPAVAIMGRVVMVPEEFSVNLNAHPRTFLSLARPLNLGGLELVDFRSQGALKPAVRRVALQLKQEWRNLCHRQMGVRRLFKPDFDELGRLLQIDSSILEGNSLFSDNVRLNAAIVENDAKEGVKSRVVLELRNDGGQPLRNIRVRVRAPLKVMPAPFAKVADLVPPSTIRLELELSPTASPCCPLEVFVDQGDDPLAIPSFPMPILLEVSPQGKTEV